MLRNTSCMILTIFLFFSVKTPIRAQNTQTSNPSVNKNFKNMLGLRETRNGLMEARGIRMWSGAAGSIYPMRSKKYLDRIGLRLAFNDTLVPSTLPKEVCECVETLRGLALTPGYDFIRKEKFQANISFGPTLIKNPVISRSWYLRGSGSISFRYMPFLNKKRLNTVYVGGEYAIATDGITEAPGFIFGTVF